MLRMCVTPARWVRVRECVAAAAAHARRAYSVHTAPVRFTDPNRKATDMNDLRRMHKDNIPITMMTAHDYPSALFCDKAGIDMILVGDSLSMVALGYQTTVPCTMEEMLHHCRAVARGARHPFLVGDMPFGSYEESPSVAVRNAIRFLKEGDMKAVKLEGGRRVADTVAAIARAGIPVLGHIGLTPQTAASLGGFRVQGRTAKAACELLEDALALQEAGCFAIVVEAVPDKIAEYITRRLEVPTIGIGAGPYTGGQVLVYLDVLGQFDKFVPKFCRQYAKLARPIQEALERYRDDVKARAFPGEANCYSIPEDQYQAFLQAVGDHQAAVVPAPVAAQPQGAQAPAKEGGGLKVAVIGAGSMGALIGGRLAAHGTSVWLLDPWAEHVAAMKGYGLFIRGLDRNERVGNIGVAHVPFGGDSDYAAIAAAHPAEGAAAASLTSTEAEEEGSIGIPIPDEVPRDFDVAIVLSKGRDTHAAGRVAGKVVAEDGVIVTLQNGLGHAETIALATGGSRIVVRGIVTHGARIEAAGEIRHTGRGTVHLAAPPGAVPTAHPGDDATGTPASEPTELVQGGEDLTHQERRAAEIVGRLSRLLRECGLGASVVRDFDAFVWSKLVANACINPITALLDCENGFVATDPACEMLVRTVSAEVANVAEAAGFRLSLAIGDPAEHALDVARATAANVSSMLADIRRGSGTEIEQINGAVVSEGKRLGVPTPANETLLNLVRALERRRIVAVGGRKT